MSTEQGALASRSWLLTIWMGALSIGGAIGAVALWENDHGFLSFLFAIGSLGCGIAAFRSKKGICPACGREVLFEGSVESELISDCLHCGAYSRVSDGRVNLVQPGFVAKKPAFELALGRLKSPYHWQWPRPHQCCVCFSLALEGIELKVSRMHAEKVVYTFSVPHCPEHSQEYEHGVNFTEVSNEKSTIGFRSFDYCREFKELNSLPSK